MGVLSSPTLSGFHGQGSSRRKGNAWVSSSGTSCTPAGGSYLLIPRKGSGVGLVWCTSEAQDSVRRRLSLSCTYNKFGSCSDKKYHHKKLLILLFQRIRSHVLIMIFFSSCCKMWQWIGCNKDGNVRHQSRSRLRPERRTIFSAQIGTTRSRFAFWVQMKWGILKGWL